MKKVFIQVPGIPRKTHQERLVAVVEWARSQGYEVLDIGGLTPSVPEGMALPEGTHPFAHEVAEAIKILLTHADELILGPGWERARTCNLLYHVADWGGKPITMLEPQDIWPATT